tara:strand:- start:2705 stop:3526 length:822 start_codon:yes stop_codon:yes gene_type:complete
MKKRLVFLTLFLVSLTNTTFAQGDLIITPNRVVFKERQVKEIINLINVGSETNTFTVSFVQRRMNEDGSFTIITEPDKGQMFSNDLLRIYPRQVTLTPGEGQVVMIQRRRNSNMKDGEYRSHLFFRAEKKITPLKNINTDPEAMSVVLTPIFGISIPIIIRSGIVNAKASISDLSVANLKNRQIKFTLNREGNISLYGDITVEYIPLKGEPVTIGLLRGVAIYTNINKRFISITINEKYKFNESTGSLKISYNSRIGVNKKELYTSKNIELGS